MKTDILTPKGLFQKDIRYIVPDFQRRYVWSLEDQWEPLWENIRNTAEEYLEQLARYSGNGVRAEEKTKPHFLGAVVIQQVTTAVKDIERREVIDGQQRLTTLQLLLDAVQWVCEKRGPSGAAKRLQKLVVNDKDLIRTDEDIFKLWPTEADRLAFEHAMSNELLVAGYEKSLIVQAHEYFQGQIRDWIKDEASHDSKRIDALEATVTGLLQLVVIDLDPSENPYIIFETLNARGTPLLESDLIKNFVISKAERQSAEIWGELGDDWWQNEVRQGRLRRPRLDVLFDYWLEMKTAEEVAAGRVFSSFQEYSVNRSVDKVMQDVSTDLKRYRDYQCGTRIPAEEVYHYRMGVMNMDAFTPILLYLLASEDRTRARALATIESFAVRRMVCRLSTKDYNRLLLELLGELNETDHERADKVIFSFLARQEAESRRWPTNEQVTQALRTLPLYSLLSRGRLRLVLEGIENYLRETFMADETACPKRLTIEHILPRQWSTNWPLLVRDGDEIEAQDTRNKLIHTIGNLTLVNKRLNASLSNAPWDRKRKVLEEHTTLKMNYDLIDELNGAAWNEEAILARSARMARIVTNVWPGPQKPSR